MTFTEKNPGEGPKGGKKPDLLHSRRCTFRKGYSLRRRIPVRKKRSRGRKEMRNALGQEEDRCPDIWKGKRADVFRGPEGFEGGERALRAVGNARKPKRSTGW